MIRELVLVHSAVRRAPAAVPQGQLDAVVDDSSVHVGRDGEHVHGLDAPLLTAITEVSAPVRKADITFKCHE